MEIVPINQIAEQIKLLIHDARISAALELNSRMLRTYWETGHIIVEYEQNGNIKAGYGKKLLPELSKMLTTEFGRGFSRSNLQNMRNFYLAYTNLPDASGKLTWSHYCELMGVLKVNEKF